MKVVTIIAGVILCITGIYCLVTPGITFLSIAFVLGCVMLFSGVSGIINYVTKRKSGEVSGWVLAEGVVTTVLSLLILSNQLITDALLPYFFGGWIILSGVFRIFAAMGIKKIGGPGWGWILALGILSVLFGIYALVHPLVAALTLGLLVGLVVLMQGINLISLGVSMKKKSA